MSDYEQAVFISYAWNGESEELVNQLAEAMKTLDPANLRGIREDMDLYDRIGDKISGLASMLKDMNTLAPDVHRDSDFSELYAAIEKRLKESPAGPYFEPKTVLIPEGPFLMDAYPAQNKFGCFDMVGNVRHSTCSLWSEKRSQPDARYSYPWKDDQRSIRTNRQIRRVVQGSSMWDAVTALRCSSRSGRLPEDTGLPGLSHGFRVVIHLEEH